MTEPICHFRTELDSSCSSLWPLPSGPSSPSGRLPSVSVLLRGARRPRQPCRAPGLESGAPHPRRTPPAHPWANRRASSALRPASVPRSALETAGQLGKGEPGGLTPSPARSLAQAAVLGSRGTGGFIFPECITQPPFHCHWPHHSGSLKSQKPLCPREPAFPFLRLFPASSKAGLEGSSPGAEGWRCRPSARRTRNRGTWPPGEPPPHSSVLLTLPVGVTQFAAFIFQD